MIILPAIDLKDGMCVRLRKGDFDTARQVARDPVETALGFEAAGARLIHMVDLDGALRGEGKNAGIVARVIESVGTKIQLGGGMRSMAELEAADGLGVYRMVIGSAAVSDPGFIKSAVRRWGDRVAVGLDAKGGKVRTHGWVRDSGLDAVEFAANMEELGVRTIIFTDIDTDGMLGGPAIGALTALRAAVGCRLIASGGVTDIQDIRKLKDIGMDGAIVGKACYAGTIDLKEAIKEAGEQCWPNE